MAVTMCTHRLSKVNMDLFSGAVSVWLSKVNLFAGLVELDEIGSGGASLFQ